MCLLAFAVILAIIYAIVLSIPKKPIVHTDTRSTYHQKWLHKAEEAEEEEEPKTNTNPYDDRFKDW